jgi:cytochrome c oxidase subunit IV
MSHSHSPAAAEGHDHDGHDAHDVASHLKIYWAVGAALFVGTVVTVLARYLDFSSASLTIAVALFIASIKAFLVAGYFMHLISEKKAIYLTLGTTAVFFAGMIALILWSNSDPPRDSKAKTHYVP